MPVSSGDQIGQIADLMLSKLASTNEDPAQQPLAGASEHDWLRRLRWQGELRT